VSAFREIYGSMRAILNIAQNNKYCKILANKLAKNSGRWGLISALGTQFTWQWENPTSAMSVQSGHLICLYGFDQTFVKKHQTIYFLWPKALKM